MDAVMFFKELDRMCDKVRICYLCPIGQTKSEGSTCPNFVRTEPEKAVELVKKWAEENPVKTFLSDFLEKFPNAIFDSEGVPRYICPYHLGYESVNACHDIGANCVECWSRPLEG